MSSKSIPGERRLCAIYLLDCFAKLPTRSLFSAHLQFPSSVVGVEEFVEGAVVEPSVVGVEEFIKGGRSVHVRRRLDMLSPLVVVQVQLTSPPTSTNQSNFKRPVSRVSRQNDFFFFPPLKHAVYARRVDFSALVFSLSSHRHSYIGLIFSSRFLDS
jgi:hypothetical protein